MKSLVTKLAVAFAAAFALTALPARACENCKDCPQHKSSAAAGDKAAPKAEKKDAKPAEKAAPAVPAAGTEVKKAEAEKKCECTKDGKGCTCKKGECKCANCGAAKVAAGEEKPKCECGKGKECACTKGECKCKHEAKRAA
jgi:hypothetical protein